MAILCCACIGKHQCCLLVCSCSDDPPHPLETPFREKEIWLVVFGVVFGWLVWFFVCGVWSFFVGFVWLWDLGFLVLVLFCSQGWGGWEGGWLIY